MLTGYAGHEISWHYWRFPAASLFPRYSTSPRFMLRARSRLSAIAISREIHRRTPRMVASHKSLVSHKPPYVSRLRIHTAWPRKRTMLRRSRAGFSSAITPANINTMLFCSTPPKIYPIFCFFIPRHFSLMYVLDRETRWTRWTSVTYIGVYLCLLKNLKAIVLFMLEELRVMLH